jgi:hypothetical protein
MSGLANGARALARIGWSKALSLTLGLALLTGAAGPAAAQRVDCDRLRAQIASLGRGGGGGYAAAAQKQRAELGRTVVYARSIGCDRRRVFIFGDDPPPQCGAINARIGAMQANLASLETRAGGGDGGRGRLMAQYDAWCRGAQPVSAPRERGLLESLFGGPSQELEQIPLDDPERTERADNEPRARGGQQAICVRKCDGGFFPLPLSRRAGNETLSELCTALCPNVEAEVFLRNSDDLDSAVSLRGDDYSSLANARKFEKSFDRACSCKPDGQSWVEALAKAESILGARRKGDLIVSPEKAQELSLPKDVRQESRRKPRKEAARKPVEPDLSAQEAASGARAPTAGSDSAGIGAPAAPQPVLGPGQGELRDAPGADGAPRKVRTIGPTL